MPADEDCLYVRTETWLVSKLDKLLRCGVLTQTLYNLK